MLGLDSPTLVLDPLDRRKPDVIGKVLQLRGWQGSPTSWHSPARLA
jgi:hypothetical protein